MKQLLLSIIILSLWGLVNVEHVSAQEDTSTLRERLARRDAQRKQSKAFEPTVRAQIKNEMDVQHIGNAPWLREVYSFLDLNKEKNGALYYPVVPIGNRVNLFTMLIQKMASGDITAYKWQLNGMEIFTEDQKVDFAKDVLEAWEIPFTEENGKYVINDDDVPNLEVQGYYLKETWYFDNNNSVFKIKTIALCPVLFRQDDFGDGTTRYPMFWIKYDDIKPYASKVPIMLSNLNNVENQTVNDFFVKHNFEGEIYKTTNMRNLTLAEMYPQEAERKEQEKKVKQQLEDVQKGLWVYNDSVATKIDKERVKSGDKSIKEAKTVKLKKVQSSSNNNVKRSMRDRKRN